MTRRWLWSILLLPLLSHGALYRYVDEHGDVVYTDRPVPGAEPVEPGTITVVPATPKTRIQLEIGPAKQDARRSEGRPDAQRGIRLSVRSPRNDEAVRANDGRVPVQVQVEPEPPEGAWRLQVLLDGEPYGPAQKSLSFTLQEVPRGTHTLQVRLLDARGRVLAQTEPVVFHVMRVSVITRPR